MNKSTICSERTTYAQYLGGLLLLLTAWAAQGQTADCDGTSACSSDACAALYAAAVADASDPQPGEIFDDLIAIPGRHKLRWLEIDGESYVLMVTWTSDRTVGYYKNDEQGFYDTGSHEIWVTAVPEVRERCSDPEFGKADLDLRLRQLLGLPPCYPQTQFVEFWVRPRDLFRPCADNEISDTSCGLTLPEDATTEFRRWFNNIRANHYTSCDCDGKQGYPWTQLGYTYDWGNPDTEVGVSEFIIRTNSRIRIKDISPTKTYCDR
ncbi:MAG: hypothetical protein GY842_08495, partial [bacterium]|nr:hypothetical protein [bacterium]